MKKIVNIICIKWGINYNSNDVNMLYHAIIKNITCSEVKFHCFTDNSHGIDENVIIHKLPILNIKDRELLKKINSKYAYQKEAALCDDNLGGLNGERVFFFDLDLLITDNLDDLINYPRDDKFYIIKDWNSKNNDVGNASCYSWVVGTLGEVKRIFEKTPMKWVDIYHTASQEYLSHQVIKLKKEILFWPNKWISSFKYSCLPSFCLRPFIQPKLPAETKILVFHGRPKAEDALIGRWYPKGYHVSWWKKIYKFFRPATWIKKFL